MQIKNVRLVLQTSILRGSDRRRDLCRPRDPQAPPLSSYRTKLGSLELKTRCRSMDHEGGDESGDESVGIKWTLICYNESTGSIHECCRSVKHPLRWRVLIRPIINVSLLSFVANFFFTFSSNLQASIFSDDSEEILEDVDEASDTFLVVSFIGETRIFAMNRVDELEETEIKGFLSEVTSSSVRLVSSETRELLSNWDAPDGLNL
ncbi:hypothetical protein F2Q70_00040255 [Brassica cretica]|uniref:Uncharacterized protein n=1 Tax=Brassica cretica TaxID=69181 RepID=A0A8S9K851_BRACR|nr:hypothetical protein F2Q70_00040255 [Brassica cretica]